MIQAITGEMMKLPINLRKTLTWDRGMEMAKHASFTIATEVIPPLLIADKSRN